MRWIFALLFLTGVAFAQSQQPSQKQNPPTANTEQQAQPQERGTEQIPFVAKVVPAPKTQADTNKEKQEKAERSRVDTEKSAVDTKIAFETQRIADYTDRLARFTLGLIVIAMFQAGMFGVQLFYMRKTFELSQRPWIDADVEIAAPFRSDGKTAILELVIKVKNVGNVAAIRIMPMVWTYPNSAGGGITDGYKSLSKSLRVGFESHEARAIRRTRSMTEAA